MDLNQYYLYKFPVQEFKAPLSRSVRKAADSVPLPLPPIGRMAPGEAEAFRPLTQDFWLCGRVSGEAGVDRLHLGGSHLP